MPKHKYLGEFAVDLTTTPFAKFTHADWALYFVEHYGGIDGNHHKTWLIDQIARILNGCPLRVVEARWDDNQTEYRVTVGTCDKYLTWVKDMNAGEDGPDTYAWEEGVPP
jgi:hypothetical protein